MYSTQINKYTLCTHHTRTHTHDDVPPSNKTVNLLEKLFQSLKRFRSQQRTLCGGNVMAWGTDCGLKGQVLLPITC